MTYFTPTTYITILRKPGVSNMWDQTSGGWVENSTKNPASIITRTVRQYVDAERRETTSKIYDLRVHPNVDIKFHDRILDELSGLTYMVESLDTKQNPNGASCIWGTLRKVGE
jgi:hypothetical protein